MDNTLTVGAVQATISPEGGYVTSLTDERGDILFSKQTLTAPDGTQKVRGGCHVCLPNFGPGGESGLAQHGFGRTNVWEVIEHSSITVTMTLRGEGTYATMLSRLHYTLTSNTFTMELTLTNNGSQGLPVAPGFHPYFSYQQALPAIDGAQITSLDNYGVAQFIEGGEHRLATGSHTLTLSSGQLIQWAVWTDQLGTYLCIEPTFCGNAFIEESRHPQLLIPGQSQSYALTIQW